MRVGFVTTDRSMTMRGELGGAAHYRLRIPADALARHTDAEVRIGACVSLTEGPMGLLSFDDAEDPEVTEAEQAERLWVPDVMIVQRYMFEGFDVATFRARAAGQVVINDVDDLFDAIPPTNGAFRSTHPNVHPDNNVQHYRKALAASSGITVSTPTIKDWLHRYCHDVDIEVIRNAIDLENWTVHEQLEPPALGWTGVLSHRSGDVETIVRLPGMVMGDGYAPRFVHIGARQGREIAGALGLEPGEVWELPLAPIGEYRKMIEAIDVGVVPLRHCSFNDAKSAIKGIEYAAAGIPFVATPTPEYIHLHSRYGIGRLADRPKQWLTQIRQLADPDVRNEEAKLNRELVATLDIENRWAEWGDLYASATP